MKLRVNYVPKNPEELAHFEGECPGCRRIFTGHTAAEVRRSIREHARNEARREAEEDKEGRFP